MNGVVTHFVWDGMNMVYEYTDAESSSYIYGTTGILYRKDSAGEVYTYTTSGRGDVVTVADSDGNAREYFYNAYGEIFRAFGSELENPLLYCGEYYDAESGFIYLRNRYYEPSIGRFITEDPVKNGLNWYIYCSNNPVNRIDPLGLFDYNARLSYSQTYNEDVEVLQNELVWLGYMDRPADGDWGYFGPKTQAAVNAYKNSMGLGNTGNDKGVVGLQTWTSLGLIYRTQADIDAGIMISMYGGRKQYKDVSVPVNKALNTAEETFRNHSMDFVWFYHQVKSGAQWDIKLREQWNATIAAGTYPGSISARIILNGYITTPEALGNITYGYLGTASGFSEGVLLKSGDFAAAGGNLSLAGLFKGVGGVFRAADSADDKANVRIGISWYNNR